MKIAEYICKSCEFKWAQNPTKEYDSEGRYMGKTSAINCPKCGNSYIEWLNFYDTKQKT